MNDVGPVRDPLDDIFGPSTPAGSAGSSVVTPLHAQNIGHLFDREQFRPIAAPPGMECDCSEYSDDADSADGASSARSVPAGFDRGEEGVYSQLLSPRAESPCSPIDFGGDGGGMDLDPYPPEAIVVDRDEEVEDRLESVGKAADDPDREDVDEPFRADRAEEETSLREENFRPASVVGRAEDCSERLDAAGAEDAIEVDEADLPCLDEPANGKTSTHELENFNLQPDENEIDSQCRDDQVALEETTRHEKENMNLQLTPADQSQAQLPPQQLSKAAEKAAPENGDDGRRSSRMHDSELMFPELAGHPADDEDEEKKGAVAAFRLPTQPSSSSSSSDDDSDEDDDSCSGGEKTSSEERKVVQNPESDHVPLFVEEEKGADNTVSFLQVSCNSWYLNPAATDILD